jgi:hypothetical protein
MNSFPAIIATEDITTVLDTRTMQAVDEVLLMAGWQRDQGDPPICDSHPQARAHHGMVTTDDVRGSVRGLHAVGDELRGTLEFAPDKLSIAMAGKVRDRHVRCVSVGAVPLEQIAIPPGTEKTVAGRIYRASNRLLFVTVRWFVSEVSVLPRGADPRAIIL